MKKPSTLKLVKMLIWIVILPKSETILSSDLSVGKTVVLLVIWVATGKAILLVIWVLKAILNTLKTSGVTTLQTTLKLVGAGTLDSILNKCNNIIRNIVSWWNNK